MTLLRNLDLLLLALAIPVFVALELPVLGYVTAAGIWALWRGIELWTDRRLRDERDPKTMAGIAAGSLVGRGWLLGLILLGAGLAAGDDDVGLSAAVLVFVLFTVHFTFKIIAPSGGAPTSTT
ncbi:MAG TPA: hypothetical protein VF587_04280 [Solirubrobacteraceae bacterium]|jgi:hypothetical protein